MLALNGLKNHKLMSIQVDHTQKDKQWLLYSCGYIHTRVTLFSCLHVEQPKTAGKDQLYSKIWMGRQRGRRRKQG